MCVNKNILNAAGMQERKHFRVVSAQTSKPGPVKVLI